MKAIKLIFSILILGAASTMQAQTQAAAANAVHPATRLSDEKQETPKSTSAINNVKQPVSVAQRNSGIKSSDDAQFNARPQTSKTIQTGPVPVVTKPVILSDQK